MGKLVLCVLGILFLAVGAVGLVLPVFPQVPFLVLGFACLMLGSKRFAAWFRSTSLYRNRLQSFFRKNRILSRLFPEEEASPDPPGPEDPLP